MGNFEAIKNTPGAGGPTPGGTAGGTDELLLFACCLSFWSSGGRFLFWSGFLLRCCQVIHLLSLRRELADCYPIRRLSLEPSRD